MENIVSNYGNNNERSGINPTRIKVIGVGGGGGNAVNRMVKAKLAGVEFWQMNTDLQVLTFSDVQNKLQLGTATTKGLGSGGDPSTGEKAALEAKDEITYDDFMKMQFQVGEIIECKAVEKSKKLLCSQVRIGSQVKQIVSGIKAHYTPEEMVGKKVMVLVNLKPAKLAGILSEGMILCAEDAQGNLALMTPEKTMPAGAEIC